MTSTGRRLSCSIKKYLSTKYYKLLKVLVHTNKKNLYFDD